MSTRNIAWHGYSLQVSVPDRLAARLRRPCTQPSVTEAGGVVFADPPPTVTVLKRDVEHAVDFKQLAAHKSRQQAVESGLAHASDDLSRQVASTSWYHTIELPGGITTPGQFDHRPILPRYGLPTDLSGQRALDVATFNGYWAFEMERRGAQVTAIDLDDPRDWDYPKPVRKKVDADAGTGRISDGFDIAHRALGSSVERIAQSVYALDPTEIGTFDLVHCGDLLLHLREPLAALERMRSVTSGRLLLSEGIDVSAIRGRYGPTVQYMGGWNDLLWWVPSLDALAQMVIDAGFSNVAVNSVFKIAKTYEDEGFWRASLTATV